MMRKCFGVPSSGLTQKVLRTLRKGQIIGVAVATTFVFVGGGNSTF